MQLENTGLFFSSKGHESVRHETCFQKLVGWGMGQRGKGDRINS